MKIIDHELERVENLIDQINGDIFQREYENDLEWWILGKIVTLLSKDSIDYPIYAEKMKPHNPDFLTYSENKNKFKPIEITEVIDPKRKRSDEYKNKISRKILEAPNLDLWNSLKICLKKKFQKKYEPECWLFIYFDIIYPHISFHGYWDRAIRHHIESWNDKNEITLECSPYEKIFITNSSASALVQIYPDWITIIKE